MPFNIQLSLGREERGGDKEGIDELNLRGAQLGEMESDQMLTAQSYVLMSSEKSLGHSQRLSKVSGQFSCFQSRVLNGGAEAILI